MADNKIGFMPGWERPIRIPERVPITHTEPQAALAGEKGTWRLPFRLSDDVPPGAVLKLQLSGGRNNKACFPPQQIDTPHGDDYLTVCTDDGVPLPVQPDETRGSFVLKAPEGGLRAGAELTVTLGDTSAGGGGTQAGNGRMLNKFFVLYRPEGAAEPPETWPEDKKSGLPRAWTEETGCLIAGACTMHILGGPIDHLHAYVPSQTAPGEPFDIVVRPEDEFSNLSHEPLDDVGAFLGDEALEGKGEKVADSVCVRVGVRLPREGVHRIKVVDRRTGKEATTNPTVCTATPREQGVYWGVIHGHSEMSDGTGKLDYYFRQMRDEVALDFGAPGDHDHLWETSDAYWDVTCEKVKQWHEPGRFVTLLGYEWAKWRKNGDGDRNVYYLQDDRPLYRSDNEEYPTPPDLFAALRDEQAMVIPHHPAHGGNFCDWKDHDPKPERLVEIYQTRGSYECPPADGNPLPEHVSTPPFDGGYVSVALAMGWRVGFTGGGDDHGGYAGTGKIHDGLMSVLASARTREAVWDAMWHRRVVATSGPRMLLSYELNGHPMGSELDGDGDSGLASARQIRVEFHGTAPIERIDVIRNNEVVHSESPGGLDCEFSWQDAAPLGDVLLPPAKFCDHPFCFYYVRAVQTDGEVAWASPVWIDGG